jgi:hypothetical protein
MHQPCSTKVSYQELLSVGVELLVAFHAVGQAMIAIILKSTNHTAILEYFHSAALQQVFFVSLAMSAKSAYCGKTRARYAHQFIKHHVT